VAGPEVGQLADLFLRACAIGAPAGELATALAQAILDVPATALALRVLEAGEHRLARAIELAEHLLEQRAAPRVTSESEAG